jgi:hypothetical protein
MFKKILFILIFINNVFSQFLIIKDEVKVFDLTVKNNEIEEDSSFLNYIVRGTK